MKRVILSVAFAVMAACASVPAFAIPTEQQVQAETSKGNFAQAQTMMKEVVAAKPGSAKAHYVYAELLAHNGDFPAALSEARLAQQLQPSLEFTDPEKFRSFLQLLVRQQTGTKSGSTSLRSSDTAPAVRAEPSAPAPSGSGVPGWVWGVGGLAAGFALWRVLARSKAATTGGYPQAGAPGAAPYGGSPYGAAGSGAPGAPSYNATNMPPYGANPGMQQQPMARPGSGMLGTGLAVGGGLAGGMLINELLHRRDGNTGANPLGDGSLMPGGGAPNFAQPQSDATHELEQRQVDFGTGNDWGDGGGNIDVGGGGDDSWN